LSRKTKELAKTTMQVPAKRHLPRPRRKQNETKMLRKKTLLCLSIRKLSE